VLRLSRHICGIHPAWLHRCSAIPPRQGRFDQVGGIHRAIRFARPHQRVHFVDEQNNLARGLVISVRIAFNRSSNSPRYLAPSNQRAHIQRHQAFVAQGFGHIAIDNAQRHAFGDGGFADTWFADQYGVIFGAA
jgi:hypothetical protein